MALDLEALLEPVSEEAPAGEDLAYDHDRAELERTFEVSESDGDAPAEQDWRAVLRLIESQFARTKDVWLAVYLARAGAESGDLETVELGAQALAGLFERYWETVHPQLEELGLPGRKAPCDSLANRRAFLGPLERTVLIRHPRLGAFTGADVKRFAAEGSAADGYGLFRATLDELGADALDAAAMRLASVGDALRRADKVFTVEAAGEDSPNYAPTYAVLNELQAAVRGFLPTTSDAEGEAAAATPGAAFSEAGQRSVSGAVNSRDDVIRTLDMIMAYYRQREPGHPMPLMLERASRWVTMDFVTLMKDIAPDGEDQAEGVLRTRKGVLDDDDEED